MLSSVAQEHLEQVQQDTLAYRLSAGSTDDQVELGDVPLLNFIPRLSPFEGSKVYVSPYWLAPGLDIIDRIIAPRDHQLFFSFSAPRFHAKTASIQACVVKHLIKWPKEHVSYYCHSENIANQRSKQIRRVLRNLGFEFRPDADAIKEWELESGGGLVAGPVTSAGQGRHPRLVIIDDPYRTAEEARNAAYRARVISAIEDDIIPMLPNDGAIILTHSRQHPDDAVGHYKKKSNWVYLNLKALTPDEKTGGEVALWTEEWPVAKLEAKRRENENVFETQYQGEPRTKSGAVFGDPTYYNLGEFKKILGTRRYRVAYGYDCAYSDKSQARGDWSVIVKMVRIFDDSNPNNDKFYVLDVYRDQLGAVDFVDELKRMWKTDRGPMMWLRAGGPEQGVADFIREKWAVPRSLASGAGKYSKAQPVSEAWKSGRVLVPGAYTDDFGDLHQPPDWVETFLNEADAFTGTENGVNDDQIDALAAAYYLLDNSVNFNSIRQPGSEYNPGFVVGSRFADMPGRGYG